MEEFDLLVVGAGSGLDVAAGAADMGLDVAIVEKGPMGGTCLNRGCIPSKMLIHRADLARKIQTSERFGIDAETRSVDFRSMVREVNEYVESESQAIESGLETSPNHALYRGEGRFVDERTVEVKGEELRGDKVVVAAGARPRIPPIEGLDEVDYLTSREALKLEEQPESMVVVGGGYVGTELAHFYGALGTEITIVGRSGLLPGEDSEVSERFAEVFGRRHEVRECEVSHVYEDGDEVCVGTEEGGAEIEVRGERLLVATGRVPNTDLLRVEEGGIETDSRDFVDVDEYLGTTAEDTWALGDVIGPPMFKHTANMEARLVFVNALTDHRHEVDYRAMPHAVFSEPQVGSAGKTEGELEREGRDFLRGVYGYGDVAMGIAMKEDDGFVKVLVDPEGEILGCHVIGPHASVLIHEAVVAMRSGDGTVDNIHDSVHVHPALNEVVKRAFEAIEPPERG